MFPYGDPSGKGRSCSSDIKRGHIESSTYGRAASAFLATTTKSARGCRHSKDAECKCRTRIPPRAATAAVASEHSAPTCAASRGWGNAAQETCQFGLPLKGRHSIGTLCDERGSDSRGAFFGIHEGQRQTLNSRSNRVVQAATHLLLCMRRKKKIQKKYRTCPLLSSNCQSSDDAPTAASSSASSTPITLNSSPYPYCTRIRSEQFSRNCIRYDTLVKPAYRSRITTVSFAFNGSVTISRKKRFLGLGRA